MSAEEKANGGENVKNEYAPIGEPIKDYGLGFRHLQIFLIFTIVATGYIIRTSVSVSVIALTDKSRNDTDWEVYDWDKQVQDYILSSFFWGYMIMQIPAGQLAQRFGGKILLVFAMVSNGMIFTVLPFAIRLGGWKAAFFLRVLQGLTQSCLMPSVHTLLGKWAPVNERSRLGNFVLAGGPFGTIIGLPLSGFLCEHYGWPITFQAIGAFTIMMGFCWFWFGSDSPAKHPKISIEEKFYIQTSLGQISKPKRMKIPWKSIATSVPVWALLCTHIGANWSLLMMLLEIPSYMKMALGINMQQSGLYSALPFMAMWIFGMFMSVVSDTLVNKKILTIFGARKLANCIGTWGMSLALIALSYIPTTNVVLCLATLTLSAGLISGINVGYMLNHIDLSPNFAGLLMAITNSISNAFGVFAPISVGMILKDTSDPGQWRTVFFLTALISSVTNIAFLMFGSSDRQAWNEPESSDDVEMTNVKLNENNAEENLKRKISQD